MTLFGGKVWRNVSSERSVFGCKWVTQREHGTVSVGKYARELSLWVCGRLCTHVCECGVWSVAVRSGTGECQRTGGKGEEGRKLVREVQLWEIIYK